MISSVTSSTGEIQTAPNVEQNNIIDPYDYNDGTDTEGSTISTTSITPLAVVTTVRGTTPTVVPTARGAGSRRGKQCIGTGWAQLLCSKNHNFLAFLALAHSKTD